MTENKPTLEDYDREMEELARQHCKGCLNLDKCQDEGWHDNLYDVVNCTMGKWEK